MQGMQGLFPLSIDEIKTQVTTMEKEYAEKQAENDEYPSTPTSIFIPK